MLSPQVLLADLLDTSPLMAGLLLELRVDCIGCSMNKFCTLEELCVHYDLDLDHVIFKIRETLDKPTGLSLPDISQRKIRRSRIGLDNGQPGLG
jgi:hypothetical protein